MLRLRGRKGGVDTDDVPVPVEAAALLERWQAVRPESAQLFCTLEGEPLSDRYVRAMVARYSVKAGVQKTIRRDGRNVQAPLNPHMLRHSYATRLIEGAVPIHRVQRALGHANLQTTARYLHVSDGRQADVLLDALDGRDDGELVRELLERVRDLEARG